MLKQTLSGRAETEIRLCSAESMICNLNLFLRGVRVKDFLQWEGFHGVD